MGVCDWMVTIVPFFVYISSLHQHILMVPGPLPARIWIWIGLSMWWQWWSWETSLPEEGSLFFSDSSGFTASLDSTNCNSSSGEQQTPPVSLPQRLTPGKHHSCVIGMWRKGWWQVWDRHAVPCNLLLWRVERPCLILETALPQCHWWIPHWWRKHCYPDNLHIRRYFFLLQF